MAWQHQQQRFQGAPVYTPQARQGWAAGRAAAQPAAKGVPAASVQSVGRVPQQLQADHPFWVLERRLIDHRLRNSHRRHVDDRLLRVHAHWVSIPVGSAGLQHSSADISILTSDDATVLAPAEPAPPAKPVNVRALLCSGVALGDTQQEKHVVKRVDVLAANELGRSRFTRAYGGLCEDGPDSSLIQQLQTILRQQCGLDLGDVTWYKFLELEYKGAPNTVFFMPAVWGGPELRVCPQVRKEEHTVTEEYVEEAAEGDAERSAGMTDEEKLAERTKTRTVTRSTAVSTIRPLKFALANLLDFQVQRQTHGDTTELCAAADALDEFLKREMASTILATLKRRQREAEERRREADRRSEELETRKRKREEQVEERKRQRLAKEEDMKRVWEGEDEGKTDDQKRAAMVGRQAQIRALRDSCKEEDRQELEKLEAAAAPTSAPLRANASVINAFMYFDRVPKFARINGCLPRVKVENVLLCLDKKMTIGEIRRLLAVPGLPETQQMVPYRALGLERFEEASGEVAA